MWGGGGVANNLQQTMTNLKLLKVYASYLKIKSFLVKLHIILKSIIISTRNN